MMSQKESTRKTKALSKWEYKSFHCFLSFGEYRVNNGIGTGSIEVSEFLNILGLEGWDLVSTMAKAADYEQILGGSGHPIGIKAHKNTGYEFIMKRQIIEIEEELPEVVEVEVQDVLSSSSSTMTIQAKNTLLDELSEEELEALNDDIRGQSEDTNEKSDKNDNIEAASEEEEEIEEPASPLLESPFYSSDSSNDAATESSSAS